MCQPLFFPLSLPLAATWGSPVNPHGFSPILRTPPLFQPLAADADSGPRRAKDLRSGRLEPPHPAPLPGPPFEGTRSSLLCHHRPLPRYPTAAACRPLHRDARAERRDDKLRPDNRMPTTTPVQLLPAWFPLSTVPRPLAAWRTPVTRGRHCRASPPRRSGLACEDKTPARVVPSTFPPRR
jgi:hypothetical protein